MHAQRIPVDCESREEHMQVAGDCQMTGTFGCEAQAEASDKTLLSCFAKFSYDFKSFLSTIPGLNCMHDASPNSNPPICQGNSSRTSRELARLRMATRPFPRSLRNKQLLCPKHHNNDHWLCANSSLFRPGQRPSPQLPVVPILIGTRHIRYHRAIIETSIPIST